MSSTSLCSWLLAGGARAVCACAWYKAGLAGAGCRRGAVVVLYVLWTSILSVIRARIQPTLDTGIRRGVARVCVFVLWQYYQLGSCRLCWRGRFTKVSKYGFVWANSHGTVANFGRSQEGTTSVKIGITASQAYSTSKLMHSLPLSTSRAHRTSSRLSRSPSLALPTRPNLPPPLLLRRRRGHRAIPGHGRGGCSHYATIVRCAL